MQLFYTMSFDTSKRMQNSDAKDRHKIFYNFSNLCMCKPIVLTIILYLNVESRYQIVKQL